MHGRAIKGWIRREGTGRDQMVPNVAIDAEFGLVRSVSFEVRVEGRVLQVGEGGGIRMQGELRPALYLRDIRSAGWRTRTRTRRSGRHSAGWMLRDHEPGHERGSVALTRQWLGGTPAAMCRLPGRPQHLMVGKLMQQSPT